jgi:hypothetical protein
MRSPQFVRGCPRICEPEDPPEQRVSRKYSDTIRGPSRQSSRHWRSLAGSGKWEAELPLKSGKLRSRSSAG